MHAVAHHDDKKAFEELFELYYQRLYRFAYYYTQCKEAAEEVVADVFINIWESRNTIDTIHNIETYLFTSVKNRSLNYLQKEKQHLYSIENFTENFQSHITPEKILIQNELQQEINEALAQLPPKCQVIFKLIRVDGLKYKEAAEILGISPKTIEVQIGIALKKLNLILRKHKNLKCKDTKIAITSLLVFFLIMFF